MKILRTNIYLEQSHITMDLLATVAGALLPLAFAPLNISILAFICPFVFLISLRDSTPKRAIWRGWLFGFACFTVGASWLYVSIHTYGNTSVIIAVFLTFGFAAILGLFFALMAFCFVKFFNRNHWLSLVIGFPCCWVLQEVLRSWILTGFPWLLLGNTQVNTWLAGYAPIVSVYGISFIVASISALALNAFHSRKYFFISLSIIIALWILGIPLKHFSWSKPIAKPISVSLVQGNIPQSVKWNPMYLSLSLDRYRDITQKHWKSDLIVWPEGAIPDLLTNQETYFSALDKQAKIHHSAVIAGVPLSDDKNQHFYNGIITLGDAYGIYMKRHLVPFGEYVPLVNLLRGLIGFFDLPMSDFSAGPKHQTLLKVKNVEIAPFLCYEIAYLDLVLQEMPQAQLILNISDDSWFGDSWASAQQLQIAQMRSLETAREQLVVGNNGITAIINAKGQVTSRAPRNKLYVLQGSVQAMQGATLLVDIGWIKELIILILLTVVSAYIARNKNKLHRKKVSKT